MDTLKRISYNAQRFIFQNLPVGEASNTIDIAPQAPREISKKPEFSELAKTTDPVQAAEAARIEAAVIIAQGQKDFEAKIATLKAT